MRRRALTRWFLGAGLLLSLCLGVLFWLSLRGYGRLSDEALIAEIHFQPLDQRLYRARLYSVERCQTDEFLIAGDQWRIDARFLKWRGWAVLLGLDARYRLERIEGRYRRLEDQRRLAVTYYALSEDGRFDLGRLSERFLPLRWLVDAEYGSSTYLPIDPAYRYRLYRTQSGIISRRQPLPDYSQGGVPLIEIKGCAGDS